ncbi:potassium transporter [Gulosibacter macacae]|uniref:Potassium transporter n=1 Tax=Gulosibacter macacae TaxID=2488791 RepID=A0A3P3VVA3_9MICO|nr:potassium transporter [Gulosibacter macacae]RRJ85908.1 potassium transporter [Gulosibacter macacae]
MPRLTTETFGAGDMTWLGSSHGIRNARTEILDVSAFTKTTHFPNGFIKSGTPVAIVDNRVVPYTVAVGTTTDAGVLAGFILTDQKVVGDADFGVPVLDHGRINVANVPYADFAAPAAAKNATTCVFA